MHKLLILLLLLTITAKAQEPLDSIEAQIKNLRKTEAGAYWEALHSADQDGITNGTLEEKAAALNLYKTALMVHHHGYPTAKEYGYPAYTTPWLTWTHCKSAALKQYTFTILLEGKRLGQLPEDRFPNYFVGGWLLDLYGLDMEFDHSFDWKEFTIIQVTLKRLYGTLDFYFPAKLKEHTMAYLAMLEVQPERTLGEWVFPQHGSNNYFTIVQGSDGNWYLFTRTGENGNSNRRQLKADAALKRFDFVDGLSDFHLVIEGDILQIWNTKGDVVKMSE